MKSLQSYERSSIEIYNPLVLMTRNLQSAQLYKIGHSMMLVSSLTIAEHS